MQAKEGIGTEFTGVSAIFFCHDGAGNFLISRRSPGARDEHGTWDPGGGGIKFGERVEDALCREVREEYCTDALDVEFLGFRDVLREHNGRPTHWIALDFKVLIDPQPVAIGEPHRCDGLRWVTLKELENFSEPFHSQFPAFLEKYRERL
ncbi:MAG: NUDIX domain-containing protein [Minisyncoccia bacterium]